MKLFRRPPALILRRYAQVLVNFALGQEEGIQTGEVVQCAVPDVAKPLALALQNEILKAGGIPLIRLLPTGFNRDYYQLANEEQLRFFPRHYYRARAKLIDHAINIIADPNPEELRQIPPSKILTARDAQQAYRGWLVEKETVGRFTWTLGLWATPAKAKLAGLSLEDYWQQIVRACFLDREEPIAAWREVKSLQQRLRTRLNALSIEWLEVEGPDVKLRVQLGADRIWKGGADRNIPSFELFTSPNWRGTEGWIRFNQPLYRYGNLLEGVELEFARGRVIRARARRGQTLLEEMLRSRHADRIGEFSLTDRRLSPITHFMAETLYDENIGGPEGNMHLAIGSAYRDCYRGEPGSLRRAEWAKLGFNDSPEHTDIVSTTPRTVWALLSDGSRLLLYQGGEFRI